MLSLLVLVSILFYENSVNSIQQLCLFCMVNKTALYLKMFIRPTQVKPFFSEVDWSYLLCSQSLHPQRNGWSFCASLQLGCWATTFLLIIHFVNNFFYRVPPTSQILLIYELRHLNKMLIYFLITIKSITKNAFIWEHIAVILLPINQLEPLKTIYGQRKSVVWQGQ